MRAASWVAYDHTGRRGRHFLVRQRVRYAEPLMLPDQSFGPCTTSRLQLCVHEQSASGAWKGIFRVLLPSSTLSCNNHAPQDAFTTDLSFGGCADCVLPPPEFKVNLGLPRLSWRFHSRKKTFSKAIAAGHPGGKMTTPQLLFTSYGRQETLIHVIERCPSAGSQSTNPLQHQSLFSPDVNISIANLDLSRVLLVSPSQTNCDRPTPG